MNFMRWKYFGWSTKFYTWGFALWCFVARHAPPRGCNRDKSILQSKRDKNMQMTNSKYKGKIIGLYNTGLDEGLCTGWSLISYSLWGRLSFSFSCLSSPSQFYDFRHHHHFTEVYVLFLLSLLFLSFFWNLIIVFFLP